MADMPPRSRRRISTALGALSVVAAVVWLVLPTQGALTEPPGGSVPTESAHPAETTTWEPTTPDPDVPEPAATTGAVALDAVSVTIPRIQVDSALIPLGVDPGSGVLVPPERYDVAGLFTAGPVPGEVGPAIIAGHVDSRAGPAVFYRLEELVPGDLVSVSLSDGQRIDFRVVEVSQYPKSAFPTDEVYGPTPDRGLRLITCGGTFDQSRRSYLDNIVVYAVRI